MKAIITDLDRTLLHTDKRISAHTVTVLRRCRSEGIRVMAASARPLRAMLAYDELVGFDAITALNGAIVSLPQGIIECGITRESGERIIADILHAPDVTLSVETNHGFYANRDIPEWQPILYRDFPALPKGVLLYKILASSPVRTLYERIGAAMTPDVYYTLANHGLIQVMSREATKWNGIRRMLAAYGLSPKDAVYFGDDQDDIEPIRRCALGVGMANAIPAVLDVARQVTDSNDNDGVAKYIEEMILKRAGR